MKTRRTLWPTLSVILAIVLVLIALPQEWKQWAPGFLRSPSLHLGLDLVGGTQLDFRISEEEMRTQRANLDAKIVKAEKAGEKEKAELLRAQKIGIEDQEKNLVEAIRTVLERRINALGVSEATITPSYIGDEKHLLVECPGVVNTQECINVVGKTIQLEFKEEFTEQTEEYSTSVRSKALAAYRRVTGSGETLEKLGQDLGSQLGVSYQKEQTLFQDQLPTGLELVWQLPPKLPIIQQGVVTVSDPDAQPGTKPTTQLIPGMFLVEVLKGPTQTGRVITEAPKAFTYLSKSQSGASYLYHDNAPLDEKISIRLAAALRGMQPGELKPLSLEDGTGHIVFLRLFEKGKELVKTSHILVSYQGASAADKNVTRTKEQALARAQDLKKRLNGGAVFETLARTESDGPSREKAGSLGNISRTDMVPAFIDVAFKQAAGKVSDPVETQFGYHLIRTDAAPFTSKDTASYDDFTLKGKDALARVEDFVKKLKAGEVRPMEDAIRIRSLFFSLQPTGWKDTTLDGQHFRAANVSLDPVTNIPVVQILFDEEGGRLFQELTKRNIGKRIAIFVGGQLVSAPTVQQEISGGSAVITGSKDVNEAKLLAQDLNTGAIPAPIHLVGQYTVEATLGSAALQTSLMAALIGTIILMIYMAAVYRVLGLVADFALLVYAVLFFALLKLPVLLFTDNYIVLTLAGMAGIILSIGMAVDANVLVFERMKEEMRKGKSIKTAVESSFKYAWPAIRDSNVSTLITCAILFLVGTSIVKGFALTLGMGVFISLFTAVTFTRWLLRKLALSPLADRPEIFGNLAEKR